MLLTNPVLSHSLTIPQAYTHTRTQVCTQAHQCGDVALLSQRADNFGAGTAALIHFESHVLVPSSAQLRACRRMCACFVGMCAEPCLCPQQRSAASV